MSRKCEICGKSTTSGNSISRSGSPKYKGGIGLNIGGVSKRQFKPNIQRLKAVVDGEVKRIKVCSRCLKAGKVQRPPARPAQVQAAVEAEARRIVEAAEAEVRAKADAEAAANAPADEFVEDDDYEAEEGDAADSPPEDKSEGKSEDKPD